MALSGALREAPGCLIWRGSWRLEAGKCSSHISHSNACSRVRAFMSVAWLVKLDMPLGFFSDTPANIPHQ